VIAPQQVCPDLVPEKPERRDEHENLRPDTAQWGNRPRSASAMPIGSMPALKREYFLSKKEKTASLLEERPNFVSVSICLQLTSLNREHVDCETLNDSSQPIVIPRYIHSSNKQVTPRLSKLRKSVLILKIRSCHARLDGTRFLISRVN
jgi:hypothetical protein